jgi:glyoxylase-like metal-dependent hydrolase (beta-lactamase superfamily II)
MNRRQWVVESIDKRIGLARSGSLRQGARSMRFGVLLAGACLLGAVTLPLVSHARAPMVKTQAPGYHRLMVGDFEVTVLSDGTANLPVLDLLKGDKTRVANALRRSFLADQVETSFNAYLVNTGDKLVLIDTGAGALFGPTLGNLTKNLRAAGYRPEQVDEVYISHMHPDHVGGLMAGGKRAFPNATVRIDQHDTAFWLSKANLDAAPADTKAFFQGAMASVNPYGNVGKLKPFDGPTELVRGIRATPTYGHTPGHTIFTVESRGEKLVLWGDLMHVAAVQFEDPTVTIAFDTDDRGAEKARQAAYADAATGGYLVGAPHLSFPGLGRLRANGDKGYVFVPLNYSSLK